MRIRFTTSIASERGGSYVRGQVLTVKAVPKEWRAWLTGGVIEILPEDTTTTAVLPKAPETAVAPQHRTRTRTREAHG